LRNLLILGATLAIFVCSLVIWRLQFANISLAGLPVMVLGVLIMSGVTSQRLALNRAHLAVALRAESCLRRVLTGLFGAILAGLGLLFVALPVIAFTALTAQASEWLTLAALCIVSGVFCLYSGKWVATHFQPAYVRAWTVGIATLVPALIFLPIMIWINCAVVEHPIAYKHIGFLEALELGPNRWPSVPGPDAAVMRFFQTVDSLKLWLVHRFEGSGLPILLYSLDSALVVLVFSRSFVAVADLLRNLTKGDI
jgi:hypothetical protein